MRYGRSGIKSIRRWRRRRTIEEKEEKNDGEGGGGGGEGRRGVARRNQYQGRVRSPDCYKSVFASAWNMRTVSMSLAGQGRRFEMNNTVQLQQIVIVRIVNLAACPTTVFR